MAKRSGDDWLRDYRALIMEMDLVSNVRGKDVIRNSGIPNQCTEKFISLMSSYEELSTLHAYIEGFGPVPTFETAWDVRRTETVKTAIDETNRAVSVRLASFVECLRENPVVPHGVEVDSAGRPYIEGIPRAIHELREVAVGSGDVDLLAEGQDVLPPKPAKKARTEEE